MAKRLNWQKANATARVQRDQSEEMDNLKYAAARNGASGRVAADVGEIRALQRLAPMARAGKLLPHEQSFIKQLAEVMACRRLHLSPKQRAWLDSLRAKYLATQPPRAT